LVIPQPVPLCLKFFSDGEKNRYLYASSSFQMGRRESMPVYGVLGTIASFILDGHYGFHYSGSSGHPLIKSISIN